MTLEAASNHHFVSAFTRAHQSETSSILSVCLTLKYQEAYAWHVCMTHNLVKIYIDADEFVEERSVPTGRVAINCRTNLNRYVAEKK